LAAVDGKGGGDNRAAVTRDSINTTTATVEVTFYVSVSNGSDSFNGSSPSFPFKTLNASVVAGSNLVNSNSSISSVVVVMFPGVYKGEGNEGISVASTNNVSFSFIAADSRPEATVLYSPSLLIEFFNSSHEAVHRLEGFYICSTDACSEDQSAGVAIEARRERLRTEAEARRTVFVRNSRDSVSSSSQPIDVDSDGFDDFDDFDPREYSLSLRELSSRGGDATEKVNIGFNGIEAGTVNVSIVASSASLTISNCVFEGDSFGVYVYNNTAASSKVVTINNSMFYYALGIYANTGQLLLQNVTFNHCFFYGGSSIYALGDVQLSINNSTFEYNTNQDGGTIFSAADFMSLEISSSTFYQNDGYGYGASIFSVSRGSITITNTSFYDNMAAAAAALVAFGVDQITIEGCSFQSNTVKHHDI